MLLSRTLIAFNVFRTFSNYALWQAEWVVMTLTFQTETKRYLYIASLWWSEIEIYFIVFANTNLAVDKFTILCCYSYFFANFKLNWIFSFVDSNKYLTLKSKTFVMISINKLHSYKAYQLHLHFFLYGVYRNLYVVVLNVCVNFPISQYSILVAFNCKWVRGVRLVSLIVSYWDC